MSLVTARQIVDFAEDGVECAEAGPGVLARGLDELIARLEDAGLTDELLAHDWIRRPAAFDTGSTPRRRKGCLFGLPAIVGFWLSPRQIVNDPSPASDQSGRLR